MFRGSLLTTGTVNQFRRYIEKHRVNQDLLLIDTVTYLFTYFVALVRKRTKPTERPPLVGEVSANFCG
jgi:hypothetical protein